MAIGNPSGNGRSVSVRFFDPESAAERYARGRPYYHPCVIERMRAVLAGVTPLRMALDVGCGTGLSSIALRPIARRIVGVDASTSMLARAPRDAAVTYLAGEAEALPISRGAVDLVTVASAFHWLARDAFLAEARRVLAPGGWLVVYDNYFAAQMVGGAPATDAYAAWSLERFLPRFPTPARPRVAFGSDDAARRGFRLIDQERYDNTVAFSPAGLVAYLVTQTNVIAAVEGAGEPLEDVRRWLLDEVTPLFGGRPDAAFRFHGPIWYLRAEAFGAA